MTKTFTWHLTIWKQVMYHLLWLLIPHHCTRYFSPVSIINLETTLWSISWLQNGFNIWLKKVFMYFLTRFFFIFITYLFSFSLFFFLWMTWRLACGYKGWNIGWYPQTIHHMAAAEGIEILALSRHVFCLFFYPSTCDYEIIWLLSVVLFISIYVWNELDYIRSDYDCSFFSNIRVIRIVLLTHLLFILILLQNIEKEKVIMVYLTCFYAFSKKIDAI